MINLTFELGPFELGPFEDDPQRGYRGTAGRYGDVMAFHTRRPNHPKAVFQAQLVSEHLPEAHVAGMGIMGQPSTHKATLQVGGTAGKLKYNSFGLTRAARALHITHAQHEPDRLGANTVGSG
ncbi:hypothetical protein [Streptomyces sp. NPDC087270]|uniref:hypothetical protein n=1 Tax=Streptomyces sp. NPDC087270 TaxID=3365774 RepID=UPI003812756C